jgi:hypothetical protein
MIENGVLVHCLLVLSAAANLAMALYVDGATCNCLTNIDIAFFFMVQFV